jgi:hypothetical protein
MAANDFSKGKNYTAGDKDLMTAIIVCTNPGNIGEPFKKFRNIPKAGKGFDEFIKFAAKFPGISHINFYEKVKQPGETKGKFIHQIQMQ